LCEYWIDELEAEIAIEQGEPDWGCHEQLVEDGAHALCRARSFHAAGDVAQHADVPIRRDARPGSVVDGDAFVSQREHELAALAARR
jgi:hypothetical protein